MTQILASLADINTYLPPNVQISNTVDLGLQVDAQRLIRGQLANSYSAATLIGWTTPDTTPELIRAVAGMLIASKFYARLLSQEDVDGIPGYALNLYNQAIATLIGIRSGTIILTDSDGNPIVSIDTGPDPQGDMSPNDADTSGPQFTMSRVLTSI